ncbi:34863_t:CDS:2 [Gigaspora margarita]|uniref:34863_t:CDS:1 n=1 Tax=Gigaspora margarita TaxID=4874 RepID=A0ABN7VFX8_GIGMA|nr:34863_t:CDS:2 [Gigaspora margarita]
MEINKSNERNAVVSTINEDEVYQIANRKGYLHIETLVNHMSRKALKVVIKDLETETIPQCGSVMRVKEQFLWSTA